MEESLFSIYEDVLSGKLNRFPSHTWEGHNDGKETFKRCFRYLVLERLELTKEDILSKVNMAFFRKYKLGGGMELFAESPYLAVSYSFPEWNLQPWELNSTPNSYWNEETCKLAVRWLFLEKLKWDRERIAMDSNVQIFKDSNIEKAVQALRKKKIYPKTGFFEAIHFSFPEFEYMKWEFRNVGTWTKEEIKENVRWIFEVKLQWTYEDILKRISRDVFVDHNLINIFIIHFGSLYEVMKYVYPDQDWSSLKELRYFIRSDERMLELHNQGKQIFGYDMSPETVIEARKLYYEEGLQFKELGERFGFHGETMSKAVKGITYAHIKEGLPVDDKYVKTTVVAKRWGIDVRRLIRLIKQGEVHGELRGAFWFIDEEQLTSQFSLVSNKIVPV